MLVRRQRWVLSSRRGLRTTLQSSWLFLSLASQSFWAHLFIGFMRRKQKMTLLSDSPFYLFHKSKKFDFLPWQKRSVTLYIFLLEGWRLWASKVQRRVRLTLGFGSGPWDAQCWVSSAGRSSKARRWRCDPRSSDGRQHIQSTVQDRMSNFHLSLDISRNRMKICRKKEWRQGGREDAETEIWQLIRCQNEVEKPLLFVTVTQLLHSGRERGQGCKDDGRSVPGAGVQSLGRELEGPEVPWGQEEKGVWERLKGHGHEETTKGGGERVRNAGRSLIRRKPQRKEERGWLTPALRALSQ